MPFWREESSNDLRVRISQALYRAIQGTPMDESELKQAVMENIQAHPDLEQKIEVSVVIPIHLPPGTIEGHCRKLVDQVQKHMIELGGGHTTLHATGGWFDKKRGEIITDKSRVICTQFPMRDWKKSINSLRKMIILIQEDGKQQEVFLTIERMQWGDPLNLLDEEITSQFPLPEDFLGVDPAFDISRDDSISPLQPPLNITGDHNITIVDSKDVEVIININNDASRKSESTIDFHSEYQSYTKKLRPMLNNFKHKEFSASIIDLEFPLMRVLVSQRKHQSIPSEEIEHLVSRWVGIDDEDAHPMEPQIIKKQIDTNFCNLFLDLTSANSAQCAITGGPNSGKSIISKAIATWLIDIGDRPIIYVRGRHIGADLVREGYDPELDDDTVWKNSLLRSMKRVCSAINHPLLSEIISQKPIIIIDGLDEAMQAGSSSALKMWIEHRVNEKIADFIFTSRPNHAKFLLDNPLLIHFQVEKLEPKSVLLMARALLDQWGMESEQDAFKEWIYQLEHVRGGLEGMEGIRRRRSRRSKNPPEVNILITPLRVCWATYLHTVKRETRIENASDFEKIIINEAIREALIEKVGYASPIGESIDEESVAYQALRHLVGIVGFTTFPNRWSIELNDKRRWQMHQLLKEESLGFPESLQRLSDREFEKLIFEEMGALYLTDEREIEWDNQNIQENVIAMLLTHDDYNEIRRSPLLLKLGISLPSLAELLFEEDQRIADLQNLILNYLHEQGRNIRDDLIQLHIDANGSLCWPLNRHTCRILGWPAGLKVPGEPFSRRLEQPLHKRTTEWFGSTKWAPVLFEQWSNYLSGGFKQEKFLRLIETGWFRDQHSFDEYAQLYIYWTRFLGKDSYDKQTHWRTYDSVLAGLLNHYSQCRHLVGDLEYFIEPNCGNLIISQDEANSSFMVLKLITEHFQQISHSEQIDPDYEILFNRFIETLGQRLDIDRETFIAERKLTHPTHHPGESGEHREDENWPKRKVEKIRILKGSELQNNLLQFLYQMLDSDDSALDSWPLSVWDTILRVAFEREFLGDGLLLEKLIPKIEDIDVPLKNSLWGTSGGTLSGWIYMNLVRLSTSQGTNEYLFKLSTSILDAQLEILKNVYLPEGLIFTKEEERETINHIREHMDLPDDWDLIMH